MFGGGEWSVFSMPEFTADREGKGVLGGGGGAGGGGVREGKGVWGRGCCGGEGGVAVVVEIEGLLFQFTAVFCLFLCCQS